MVTKRKVTSDAPRSAEPRAFINMRELARVLVADELQRIVAFQKKLTDLGVYTKRYADSLNHRAVYGVLIDGVADAAEDILTFRRDFLVGVLELKELIDEMSGHVVDEINER